MKRLLFFLVVPLLLLAGCGKKDEESIVVEPVKPEESLLVDFSNIEPPNEADYDPTYGPE